MYVRKFEADTLDEALKNIKKELGPDAIILKTVTNKGLKGAFKKGRIEITAAISEKNYTKKAKVDRVLDGEQKEKFYSNNASYISNMIDSHAKSSEKVNAGTARPSQNEGPSYGKLGLNKQVKSTKEEGQISGPSLDEFLKQKSKRDMPLELSSAYQDVGQATNNLTATSSALNEFLGQGAATSNTAKTIVQNNAVEENIDGGRIEELEKQIYLLSRQVQEFSKREPTGLNHLRSSLRSLDISEVYINGLAKKMMFDLGEKELDSVDIVYEFALKEMLKDVHVDMPLFSQVDNDTNVITVLLSETSSGQSSMAIKLAALKNDAIIITNDLQREQKSSFVENKKISFAEKIFDLTIIHTSSIAEIVSECRKAEETGRSVFIDYKNFNKEINEARRFIDGLQRSFRKVEVLISLSAIHTELYNKKVMAQYRKIANGIIVSHLDLCLNFGAIFNLTSEMKDLPFKFYGTGDVIPDDLESATGERILAGIFQLD